MTPNFNLVTVLAQVQNSGAPSGWETYYVVFLSSAVALGIPLLFSVISAAFVRKSRANSTDEPRNDLLDTAQILAEIPQPPKTLEPLETTLGRRINTRFFLGANAALILVALTLVLVPYASIFHAAEPAAVVGVDEGAARSTLLRGLVSIVSIALFSGLGLLYSARKGDLNWLNTFRDRGQDQE